MENYFTQIYNWFWLQVQTNDFANGALIAGIGTFVLYQLRSLPQRIYSFFTYLFIFTIETESTEGPFLKLMNWAKKDIKTPIRSYEVRTCHYDESNEPNNLIAGNSSAYGIKEGIPYKLVISSRNLEMPNGNTGGKIIQLKMSFPVIFKKRILAKIEEIKSIKKSNGKIDIYSVGQYGEYGPSISIYPRKLESIILDKGLKEKLLIEFESFFDNKEKYHSLGIPWRRGYMFSGEPGCGKTSMITALAGKFGCPIYYLSLGGCKISDSGIIELFSHILEGSIIVIEDFDRLFNNDKNVESQEFTTSGLLNAIDGICSKEGRILIVTCNDTSNLPEAIKRTGRIDSQIVFTGPNEYKVSELIKLIKGCEDKDLTSKILQMNMKSMSDVQEYLINHFLLTLGKKNV